MKYFYDSDRMSILKDKPPTKEQLEITTTSSSGKLLPISLALLSISILIIVASFQNVTKADEDQLETLQAKVDNLEPLEKYEKEAYCELLWKVKQVRLCACKKNFIEDIGGVTGYKVKNTDLDWRDSGKTFEEALQEAFKRTRVPLDQFRATKWSKDLNGKSGVVEWRSDDGAEVSIDAPHETEGPDVFHIGFQSGGKRDQVKGHIFIDCVPFFRTKTK